MMEITQLLSQETKLPSIPLPIPSFVSKGKKGQIIPAGTQVLYL